MSEGFDGGSPFRTAFERIGGESALSTFVEQFFDRVLADPQLSRFFVDAGGELDERSGRGGQEHGDARVDPQEVDAREKVDLAALRRMFGQLIAGQLGAQTNYEGRNLTQAHRGLAISSVDYDRMSELFVETLWDNHVPDDIVLVTAEKLAALKPLIVEVYRPACVTG